MKHSILTAALLLSVLGMQAQEEVLTIDNCRQMALQHNKALQSASLSVKSAEYTRKSTRGLFFPDLSLKGAALYSTIDFGINIPQVMLPVVAPAAVPGGFAPTGQFAYFPGVDLNFDLKGIYNASLSLAQPIFMGGKIVAGYKKSKIAVDLYRQNQRKTEAEVIQQVDEAYAKVVQAKELLQVAERYRELLQELDKNVESAVRHGMRMQADRMKVQVKLSEVELQMRRAQNGVRLATMNLCHATGQPLTAQLQVSNTYPAINDARQLSDLDIFARPEYQMLDYQTQLAEQDVKMTRAELLPQLALLANYGYTYGAHINDNALFDKWNFAGGVTLNVPIYHFGERINKLKAAKVKVEQAKLDRDSKAELMMLELTQASNNLDESQLEVALAEKTQEEAYASMQISKKQFEAGIEPLSNYLEAQAVWQKAYEARVNAHFQLYLSSVNYLRAAGLLVK